MFGCGHALPPDRLNHMNSNAFTTPQLPRPDIDPDGLLEYSVVFTDRSLNHMSQRFQSVMRELLDILRTTYSAHTAAVVPGGGTSTMESVARQFATDKLALVVRNGLFSYRWSQIFDAGAIPAEHHVAKARHVGNHQFTPAPIAEVTAQIRSTAPDVVFAPHVETAAGILLPDDYIHQLAEATHAVGGLFVLDCVASGPLWVNMETAGVDVLVSAPQKGWSGSPAAGYVMLSEAAHAQLDQTQSSSFALNLKTWVSIAQAYVNGSHGYHSTLPTDTLVHNLAVMKEALEVGLDVLRERQLELGTRVRAALGERGLTSVAAPGFESPTVVVSNTDRADIVPAFAAAGVQVAAGVPLHVDEPADLQSFRVGLFGLDKWADVTAASKRFEDALDQVLGV